MLLTVSFLTRAISCIGQEFCVQQYTRQFLNAGFIIDLVQLSRQRIMCGVYIGIASTPLISGSLLRVWEKLEFRARKRRARHLGARGYSISVAAALNTRRLKLGQNLARMCSNAHLMALSHINLTS